MAGVRINNRKRILVTGGTVFVSRTLAEYFVQAGHDVFVLNRNTRPQPHGVTLIQCDRNDIRAALSAESFDVVLDVTAYTSDHVRNLLYAVGAVEKYVLISSSAVYPETERQPFKENCRTGRNVFWGYYGVNKIQAEEYLLSHKSDAYVLRPPYLYGPGNNIYREAFVFDCAEGGKKFYIPRDGRMQLQFFYVMDLCRVVATIIDGSPEQHIMNVGNEETISVLDWVRLCYKVVGRQLNVENVFGDIDQRKYFCFHDYEYKLDVSAQKMLFPKTYDLEAGLAESYRWYRENRNEVRRKDYRQSLESY